VEELEKSLKSMLQMARSSVREVYESDEFLRSNMDLAGHIFLRLVDSKMFKYETKILPEATKNKMTEGVRQISQVVANDYLKNSGCDNEYELKILKLIKETPMWDFQIVDALGQDYMISSGTMSALQMLIAKGLAQQDEHHKYYAEKSAFEVEE